MNSQRRSVRLFLASIWLILTSTLIVWWMRFALNLIQKIGAEPTKFRTMLFWEGATLLGLLIVGGVTLIYFINHEARQSNRLREFLAQFSHDIKTALAGVRLQAESLRADNRDPSLEYLIDRLATDTSRLQNQVENSLFVGRSEPVKMYPERISIGEVIDILKDSWPRLKMIVEGDVEVWADRRALESILNNLFHNSIVHGEATEVRIQMSADAEKNVTITISDNGRGFVGDLSKLGQVFLRTNARSGSGLGLYTVKSYVDRQGGKIIFNSQGNGFSAILNFSREGAE